MSSSEARPTKAERERHRLLHARSRRRGRLTIFRHLGPGLITGASDDDPSGIGTYSQLGAQFGLSMLWTVPLSLPLATAVEEAVESFFGERRPALRKALAQWVREQYREARADRASGCGSRNDAGALAVAR